MSSDLNDYINKNRTAWDQKTDQHVHSDFYELEAFLKGKNVLRGIELDLLGDVNGKRILHLQCHFGMDSLSLARMGASVVGADFSKRAIDKAKELNNILGLNTRFICCDLYNLPMLCNEQFDIVFTSYGTIGWLPDLERWATVIEHFLVPGGTFIMADFHPFIWTFDDNMQSIAYDYFKSEPIVEIVSGTYADRSAPITTETISWNHGMSEILNSLITKNLRIEKFNEHDYSPYNCLNDLEEQGENVFRFKHIPFRIPIVYSIVARKEFR
jgi:2-polyprenyl-3-methyl-5-hydroxy-6-metoxy-1,4-benzoquinol methylase